MKLYDYLGIDAARLQEFIDSGMIDTTHHDEFPLVMFTYGRKAVSDNTWPEPVRKCRGLIVREDTEEIIARPFEKFFNYGDPIAAADMHKAFDATLWRTDMPRLREPDVIVEKMDGFLCTLYSWQGQEYIASKGSFHSPHAKWATATYRQNTKIKDHWAGIWPIDYTPVFEGITKNLRIVVDYGEREELVLIGLINRETGDELPYAELEAWGRFNGFNVPTHFHAMTLEFATAHSLDSSRKNFEGYVAVWHRPGQTPFRLKIKYQDYLRIHRMVCGVSPKRIYEALVAGWTDVFNEWTDESTPWFNKFVAKWQGTLQSKYTEIEMDAATAYTTIQAKAVESVMTLGTVGLWQRKAWAEAIKEYPEDLHSVLFALHDGKDVAPFIWKRVKPLISGSRPMVDAAKM